MNKRRVNILVIAMQRHYPKPPITELRADVWHEGGGFMQQHYPKPPITEAIIDLSVELHPNTEIEQLKRAHDGQESAYPQGQAIENRDGAHEGRKPGFDNG